MSPAPNRIGPRGLSLVVAMTAALVLGTAVAVPAIAIARTIAATAAAPVAASVPVMIVLDASGSMKTADAPGPRIDAAKAAVAHLIDTLPADAQVGLQVYGTGTGSSDAEKPAGCADIVTLVPVGPLDATALKTAVAGVSASGYTPIGNALRAAADGLPNEGPRSIVLVSDGEDTCAPPAPCDVAAELKQQGIDLTIHTVGFKVDAVAREQLSCIADATGGTYSDAGDATQLSQALQVKVDYAITGYDAEGAPVTGLDQPDYSAPLLRPGQYTDTFQRGASSLMDDGSTLYYTVPAAVGFTPYVSVTMVAPANALPGGQSRLGNEISFVDSSGEDCGRAANDGEQLFNDIIVSPSTVLVGDPIDVPLLTDCGAEDTLILRITRTGQAYAPLALTAEIAVRMEPPVDVDAMPGATTFEPAPEPPQHGAATPAEGSTSFNDATEITSGMTYSGSITTGESRYYKIQVGWGQQLAYTLTEIGSSHPTSFPQSVSVDWFNPVRQRDPLSQLNTYGSWYRTDLADPLTGRSEYPVRYLNRDSSDSEFYSVDGSYYLRINGSGANSDAPMAATYLLTVAVAGTVEPGPDYVLPATPPTTPPSADTGTATTGTARASSTDTAPTAAPTDQSSAVVTSGATTTALVDVAGGTDNSASNLGIIAAAVAALIAVAGAALWLSRRRRAKPSAEQPQQWW